MAVGLLLQAISGSDARCICALCCIDAYSTGKSSKVIQNALRRHGLNSSHAGRLRTQGLQRQEHAFRWLPSSEISAVQIGRGYIIKAFLILLLAPPCQAISNI